MEKKFKGMTDVEDYTINQEVRGHTTECAYNMFIHATHDDCRDCKCHRYRKY